MSEMTGDGNLTCGLATDGEYENQDDFGKWKKMLRATCAHNIIWN